MSWRRITHLLLPAAALLAVLAVASPARALEVGVYEPGTSVAALTKFEDLVGRRQDYYMYYQDWSAGFDASLAQSVVDHGAIPIVTWAPDGVSLASIEHGHHDGYLRAFADRVRSVKGTVYLRPMHEMNGDWYSWGYDDDANPDAAGNTPYKFKAAWRHIVDIFREEGANNAAFVFSPTSQGPPDWDGTSIADYYPGDDYVDLVAIDGFNFGTTRSSWSSHWRLFDHVFWDAYSRIVGFTDKPILIGETGSVEQGGDKAEWIDHAFGVLADHYPRVVGLVWFDATDGDADFSLKTSPESLAAYREQMRHLDQAAPPSTSASPTVMYVGGLLPKPPPGSVVNGTVDPLGGV